jgi:tRNA U38,U39,U40 pseudouridine synthase TruA
MEMDKMKKCEHCEERFISNNKLFQHLVSSHGVERDSIHSVRPRKIILLVGWLSHVANDEEKGWEMDGHLSHTWTTNEDRVETELFQVIDQVDGGNISMNELQQQQKTLSSSRGLSRASSCAQRASHLLQIEKTSHSVTDVFCFQIPGKSKPKDQEWIDSVNALLPNDIRVIEVYNLPNTYTEFHAEAACSQRVYEYVLPLHILFPPFMMETGAGSEGESDHEIKLEYRKVKEKVWCKMDTAFPRDTPQALKRIENFRRLKVLLKLFCGKNSYHNFITGGASPEDGHVKRRVDRFYHKEMLSILYHNNSSCGSGCGNDNGGDEITISDVCHDPFYNNTTTDTIASSTATTPPAPPTADPSSPISEDWAVLSMSGNTFLKGQPRRMVGLAIAVMWGWLPLSFIEAALDPENIVNLPAVPGCGLYLSECRYDKWEAKSDIRFDPRRIDVADLTHLNRWVRVVQTHAVKAMVKNGFDWMEEMKSQCEIFLLRYETERSLRLRTPEELMRRIEPSDGDCYGIPTTLPSEVYHAYETVLRLLREADASGQWPLSSQVHHLSSPPVLFSLSIRQDKRLFQKILCKKKEPKVGHLALDSFLHPLSNHEEMIYFQVS